MKEKENNNILFYYCNIIFLFLFFGQILNFPNKLTLICTVISFFAFTMLHKKIIINFREILLSLSMFLYALFSKKELSTMVSVTLLPGLFFVLGRNILYMASNLKVFWKKLAVAIMVLTLGYYFHGILNSILFFKEGQIFYTRVWTDIWTRIATPATAHELLFFPILSLFFPSLIYLKKYKGLCITGLLASIYGLFFSIISSSRTPIVIFVIILLFEVLCFLIINRKNKKILQRAKKVAIISIVILILLSGFAILNFDYLQNSYLLTTFNRDGGIVGNIRFRVQYNVLTHMFEYPLGGYNIDMEGISYAHNVWLDIANAAGIIPFFLFLAYTIFTFIDLFKLIKNRNIPNEFKYVLSGIYLSFILYYMVEPALDANVQYILGWTYINGIIFALKNKNKKETYLKTHDSPQNIIIQKPKI